MVIDRIFNNISGPFEGFHISLSIGVAQSAVVGVDYEDLFHAADKALYCAKKSGRGRCCYFDASMDGMFSVLSEIEGEGAGERSDR